MRTTILAYGAAYVKQKVEIVGRRPGSGSTMPLNAGISVVGIPFKFEYIPDLNFTWSQAQGNYSSKVHYPFQAKTVKLGNRAVIRLDDTSGCLDSSTVNDLKAKGYWDDIGNYAAFPPGFIVVFEMPHAGVQLLKTKMLWEIPMNGTGDWVRAVLGTEN